jgi:hypothetical protein
MESPDMMPTGADYAQSAATQALARIQHLEVRVTMLEKWIAASHKDRAAMVHPDLGGEPVRPEP